MENNQNKTNIIDFKKPFQFNIGKIIFAVLLVYLIIIIISYALRNHVSAYEVQIGTLVSNNSYKALAVRKETVVRADTNGYITYFPQEGSKISYQSKVYALSPQSLTVTGELNTDLDYSGEELKQISELIDDFYYSFDDSAYYNTYNFYNTLNSNLLSMTITHEQQQTNPSSATMYYGNVPGVIVYQIDGLEKVTVDNFTDEEINYLNYSSKTLTSNSFVEKDDAIYKVITDENWSLIIEVDNKLIHSLEGKKQVKIRFLDDDVTCNVPFESMIKNGRYYLTLHLSDHMIRYAEKRYIDIEIITEIASGYKIPNSCISKEDFVKIPVQYATVGGNSSSSGFLKQIKNSDGEYETSFTPADLYMEEDGFYYVLAEEFNVGDKIIIPSTGSTFVINEKVSLDGVYSINKGYTVFKLIEILYQNEDYCIIAKNTSYGVSNYDHIVLDGTKVRNGQMIN